MVTRRMNSIFNVTQDLFEFHISVGPEMIIWTVHPLQKVDYGYGINFQLLIRPKSLDIYKKSSNMKLAILGICEPPFHDPSRSNPS